MPAQLAARQPAHLLLVEDSDDDIFFAQHAIRESRFAEATVVHLARDGVEALQFLRHESPFEAVPRPDLILLDLNMPRMDGREMLSMVKSDPVLKSIPVIILTTSDWEVDITNAYRAHANSYMTKPVDLENFAESINLFLSYWRELIKLPAANLAVALSNLSEIESLVDGMR
jgi:CheY-like chemotaxis protein